MSVVNPYRSPLAELEVRHHDGCRRDGAGVFLPHGSDLPPRCVRCNAPAAAPLKSRTLYWHSPWLYLVLLVNLLVYAIVALVVRKRVEVGVGLCETHRRSRRRDLAIGLGVLVAGVVGVFVAASADRAGTALLSGLVAFVAMVTVVVRTRSVRATRIDDTGARLVGFGRPFLDALDRR